MWQYPWISDFAEANRMGNGLLDILVIAAILLLLALIRGDCGT